MRQGPHVHTAQWKFMISDRSDHTQIIYVHI